MTSPDSYRKRAQEQHELASKLIEEADLLTNKTKLVSTIIGFVNFNLFSAVADILEEIQSQSSLVHDPLMDQRKEILKRNSEIRHAAAKGDWSEFDRLVREIAERAGKSSSGGS